MSPHITKWLKIQLYIQGNLLVSIDDFIVKFTNIMKISSFDFKILPFRLKASNNRGRRCVVLCCVAATAQPSAYKKRVWNMGEYDCMP